MRSRLLVLLMALTTHFALPAGRTVSATSFTVELFSTTDVKSIRIAPIGTGGVFRTCSRCSIQPVDKSWRVSFAGDGIRLGTGTPAAELYLEGSFQVSVDDSDHLARASGKWRITRLSNHLQILLTMPSETYVAAALMGEAATDEPTESLKAMAVAIRTFALVNHDRHIKTGFGLCDSTHCQALHFGSVRPGVKLAVAETVGETLWFGDHRASVYYTQNCGGHSEDVASVWPKQYAPYLVSHADPYCLRRSSAEWQSQIPLKQLETILREEGWKVPPELRNVNIVKRSANGRVRLLELEGVSKHSFVSASSLRFAIDRRLGWNQLRSDWYEVDIENRVLKIRGRGFGHGMGLCQSGAFEMAMEGRNYRDILDFYYPGTVTRVSHADKGWKTVNVSGIKLMTVDVPPFSSPEIIAQWHKAMALFPSQKQLHPTLVAMPTTELFRQITGEPGWLLAVTRGREIYLQPNAVLRANGNAQASLLHELLHVLVEAEAQPDTPIWIREGLVEMLATPEAQKEVASPTNAEQLERDLTHPADQHQSRRAHLEAAKLVRQLIDRYGFSAVRGWLAKGVPQSALDNP